MKPKKIGEKPPRVNFGNKPQDPVNMDPLANEQQLQQQKGNQPNAPTQPNMMQYTNPLG